MGTREQGDWAPAASREGVLPQRRQSCAGSGWRASFDESETEGVGFVLDLTERKRAEKELRSGEVRLRTFVDHATDAFFLHGSYGTVLDVNRYACESLGHGRDELIGMAFSSIDPYASAEVIARMRQRLSSKEIEILTFEFRHRRKDGTLFPVEVRVREFRQYGQSFALALARDITDRNRAEKALRESEEQWKAVFENNPTMYFMVDASGAIMSVNPFGAEQLGFTVTELIGLPVRELFHGGDREAVERNTAICFKQQGQTVSWEARKIRKDGEALWVRETARVMLIKNRPVALIVCEDITERKRVSETLAEMQTERRRELRRNDGAAYGFHRARSEPTARRHRHQRTGRVAVARSLGAEPGGGSRTSRPHRQGRGARGCGGRPNPRFDQKGAAAQGPSRYQFRDPRGGRGHP